MTYRGLVRNGQFVLEQGATLRDGAVVDVTLVEASNGTPPRGSPQAVLSSRARWIGPEDEADQILREMNREKWAEVEAEQNTPDAER